MKNDQMFFATLYFSATLAIGSIISYQNVNANMQFEPIVDSHVLSSDYKGEELLR